MADADVPLLDSHAAFRDFKDRCEITVPDREKIAEYLFPYGYTIARILKRGPIQTFLDDIAAYTGQRMGDAAGFCNNLGKSGFGDDRNKAIIFWLFNHRFDFYRMRPANDPREKPNIFTDRGLWDLLSVSSVVPRPPEGHEPSAPFDNWCLRKLPQAGQQAAAQGTCIPADKDVQTLEGFLSAPEGRRSKWRLHRGKQRSVDREAFGFELSEANPGAVGEPVALLFDVTANISYRYPGYTFCLRAVRFRANLDSEDLSIREYNRKFKTLQSVGEGVTAQILSGGSSYLEVRAEPGFLCNGYVLYDDWFVKLEPSALRCRFDAELYIHVSAIHVLPPNDCANRDLSKQVIIDCIAKEGFGTTNDQGLLTLVTQSFTIAPA